MSKSYMTIFKHSPQQIKERLKMIDWKNYELPHGAGAVELRILSGNIEKYKNLLNNLTNQGKYDDIGNYTTDSIFLFDPCYVTADKKTMFYKSCANLVNKIKNVFYFNQKISKMFDEFDAIDNYDFGIKTVENSVSLRAIRIKMISSFYDSITHFFLSLMMDFLYDIPDFRLMGLTHDEAAEQAFEIVIIALHKYEDDFNDKYGGKREQKILENDMNKVAENLKKTDRSLKSSKAVAEERK